ncbi:MAG: chemotaxis response regulator protein-glutamate methylesterase [Anaerolineae bacterium]|jgi:two-component system chemotaxis response regulator CheB|nr:MAG: chemotaxis response regulator protein-glutamate methylesterase [Anaerolineae bacterium]
MAPLPPSKPSDTSSPQNSGDQNIRVLIVDDSAFMRYTLTRRLGETPGLTIVGAAHDGKEALNLLESLKPDVITLDVEMPHMDGLTTLRQIMATRPTPVIMVSSLTTEGARETIQALTFGAIDFIAKPESKANIEQIIEDLVVKIRRAAKAKVIALAPSISLPQKGPGDTLPKKVRPRRETDKVVVIGASTGGPRALNQLIPQLSADLPAAFVIVQHMPVGFTRSLAERLNSLSELMVKEAEPGDRLEVGKVLVAPGGFHMVFDKDGSVSLNQNPTVHGVRPAVDVTLISVAQNFGKATVAVVLTGMGRDGANGAVLTHSVGGKVIAEDESSCVVWGMPRSVVEAGVADEVAPLANIPDAIARAVQWT